MQHIMVVDDTTFMRMHLRNMLNECGHYLVTEASSGEEALRGYRQQRPDLVLMDITMPEMDGLETLQRILKLDPTANVIMCSAMGQQQMVVRAISGGALDFLVKPVQKDRLEKAVRFALSLDKNERITPSLEIFLEQKYAARSEKPRPALG